jgi:hypothetical protein
MSVFLGVGDGSAVVGGITTAGFPEVAKPHNWFGILLRSLSHLYK